MPNGRPDNDLCIQTQIKNIVYIPDYCYRLHLWALDDVDEYVFVPSGRFSNIIPKLLAVAHKTCNKWRIPVGLKEHVTMRV